jgi:hypothetical protein
MYYESPGKVNLDQTLELVKEKLAELKIKDIVLATSTGFTARKALEALKGTDVKLTIVSVDKEWWNEALNHDVIGKLEKAGHKLCFMREISPYPFFKTASPYIKAAYSRLSSGLWVAVFSLFFAVDQGFVSTDKDIIAIASYDTALVVKPATSENFLDFKIREVICKAR